MEQRRRSRRRQPWLPRRRRQGEERKPFLPPQPAHTDTAIQAKLTGKPRRRKLFTRTIFAFLSRWRYAVSVTAILALVAVLTGFGLVSFRDEFNNSDALPTQTAPSLAALNQSIALGQNFASALYKPLPGGGAVQSEASGLPLKAYFSAGHQWVLLGEEVKTCPGHPDQSGCAFTTSLMPEFTGTSSEGEAVTFNSPAHTDALNLSVTVNWSFATGQWQIVVTPRSVLEPAQLWLDNVELASYLPGTNTRTTRVFSDHDQSLLRQLRFTERHATQESYLYWSTYGHDKKRASALAAFLTANGYTPGFDLRAPLFGVTAGLPDDMPTDGKAYPDCNHIARSDSDAYAYHSKVCLFTGLYLDNGERDPFLQAWLAFTVLQKYHDPNHGLPGNSWWLQGGSPAQVAYHLQGQWNRSGDGIPKCTPFSCAEDSSIRTSIFGALEAELGYRFGNEKAARFADAAAAMIVKTQVGPNGLIREGGTTYYRPAQVGSYLAAWGDNGNQFVSPSTPAFVAGIAFWVTGQTPIPPEYVGLVVSNSETSFDAIGFLQLYRCLKYHVCG